MDDGSFCSAFMIARPRTVALKASFHKDERHQGVEVAHGARKNLLWRRWLRLRKMHVVWSMVNTQDGAVFEAEDGSTMKRQAVKIGRNIDTRNAADEMKQLIGQSNRPLRFQSGRPHLRKKEGGRLWQALATLPWCKDQRHLGAQTMEYAVLGVYDFILKNFHRQRLNHEEECLSYSNCCKVISMGLNVIIQQWIKYILRSIEACFRNGIQS